MLTQCSCGQLCQVTQLQSPECFPIPWGHLNYFRFILLWANSIFCRFLHIEGMCSLCLQFKSGTDKALCFWYTVKICAYSGDKKGKCRLYKNFEYAVEAFEFRHLEVNRGFMQVVNSPALKCFQGVDQIAGTRMGRLYVDDSLIKWGWGGRTGFRGSIMSLIELESWS